MSDTKKDALESLADDFYVAMHVLEDKAERLVLSYIDNKKLRIKLMNQIHKAHKRCSAEAIDVALNMGDAVREVIDTKQKLEETRANWKGED